MFGVSDRDVIVHDRIAKVVFGLIDFKFEIVLYQIMGKPGVENIASFPVTTFIEL